MSIPRQFLRALLLLALGFSLCATIDQASETRAFYMQPGAESYSAASTLLLAAYAVAVVYVLRLKFRQNMTRSFQRATSLGIFATLPQFCFLVLEGDIVQAYPRLHVPLAALTAVTTFAFWAVAAFRPAVSGKTLKVSLLLAVWSSIVTMSFASALGLVLRLFVLPIPPEFLASSPAFARNSWIDVPASALASVLGSLIVVLSVAPMAAAIFGLAASAVARTRTPAFSSLGAKKRRL